MFGFLTLSPEEIEIVSRGSIPEPGYRPFPGGRDESDEDERFDDYELVGQRKYARPYSLERIAAAGHWKQGSCAVLLLLDRNLSTIERQPGGQTSAVVAVAYAESGPRTAVPGTRRLIIGPWKVVAPFPASELLAGMKGAQYAATMEMANGQIRALPPAASRKVFLRLREIIPNYSQIVADLTRAARDRRRSRSQREFQRRDAVATALRIFHQRWRSAQPIQSPEPSTFAQEIDDAVRNENDFLVDDAAVFPGWERSARSHNGWWEFHNKGRRLLVKNINASVAEARSGADLVYVRRDPDSVVLVQYKLLKRLTKSGEYVYRPDRRLSKQLARMLSYTPDRLELDEIHLEDYRLGHGFTFVKFLEVGSRSGISDDEITPGYYMPSEVVQRMLKHPKMGPNGGTVHYITRHRYIDGTTFVKLVQDSWIGSAGSATEQLRKLVGILEPGLRNDTTIAVEEPLRGAPVETPPTSHPSLFDI